MRMGLCMGRISIIFKGEWEIEELDDDCNLF